MMKLTKFVHSCVFVENNGRTVLFDPGVFSTNAGALRLDILPEVHEVVITHEHPDHFDEDFVALLAQEFPNAQFVTTASVVEKLAARGITQAVTTSTPTIAVTPLAHETVEPLGVTPQNIQADLMNKVTHPGDSHHIKAAKEVLLLPVTAPWGTLVDAIHLAFKLKPRVVVPIHDGMWDGQYRTATYERLEKIFAEKNILFIKAVDGQAVEL